MMNFYRHLLPFFLSCLLLSFNLFNVSLVWAEEGSEYRFERLWPRQEKSWYYKSPVAIAIAKDNSIYLSDADNSCIHQFSNEGDLIRSWGSKGSANGQFIGVSGIAVAPNGNVYITDELNNRIQQFTAKGEFIRTWGEIGTENGQFFHPRTIAIDSSGQVYIADFQSDRIQKFSEKGEFLRVWGKDGVKGDGASFTRDMNANGIVSFADALAITSDDVIYSIDRLNQRIHSFNSDGNFIQSWSIKGSENVMSIALSGIAIAPDDSLYISEMSSNSIQKYNLEGVFLGGLGSTGQRNEQFNRPLGIAVDSDNQVFVADFTNDRIQKFDASGNFISSWGGRSSELGQFNEPNSIAIAPDGNVYVADTNNHRIQQFDEKGKFISAWEGDGTAHGKFSFPFDVAVAPNGNVYVADSNNDRIQQFSAEGVYIRKWGFRGSQNGSFSSPLSLSIASDGSVYVADTLNRRIQQFNAEGRFIRTFEDIGSENKNFISPNGIAIGPDGSVYVSDEGNQRIQQFSADGNYIKISGTLNPTGEPFVIKQGLAVGLNGDVFIANTAGGSIQQFNADGDLIRSLGDYGSGDGQFIQPKGIAITQNGSLYIADTANHRIQKFAPQSIEKNSHPYKAILFAATNNNINDIVSRSIWRVMQKAYKTLTRQAFKIHDEIRFFTVANFEFDLDNNKKFDDLEIATKENLQLAITEWASDAVDVVIFLAINIESGTIQISANESLTVIELNSWIEQLEEHVSGTVTLVIEGSNSRNYFNTLSKSGRNLIVSTETKQSANFSNEGLNTFSFSFWSELGDGASFKDAFLKAEEFIQFIRVNNEPQNPQVDTNGDQLSALEDLDTLENYCLGLCNKISAITPAINLVSPENQTLNGDTGLNFRVTVESLEQIDRVWALIQRPNDINIILDQPFNFEIVKLLCNNQNVCQGLYDQFDYLGEYTISFFVMDVKEKISFPKMLTVNQAKGKAVFPVEYDDQLAVVYLRDVIVNGNHLQAALKFEKGKYVVTALDDAQNQYKSAAQFDSNSNTLIIPLALAFDKEYQAIFKYIGNLEFDLESAMPK